MTEGSRYEPMKRLQEKALEAMLPPWQEPGWYRGRYRLVPSDEEGAGLFFSKYPARRAGDAPYEIGEFPEKNPQTGLPKLEISEGEKR